MNHMHTQNTQFEVQPKKRKQSNIEKIKNK